MAKFDPQRIIQVLAEHKVRYVLIGGLAAAAHGSPSVTQDLDICYDRAPDNLERLASSLKELEARLRGAPDDLPFLLDARTLAAGDHLTFQTDAGDFDCLGTPTGTAGYGQLLANAVDREVDSVSVKVAALNDLIEMKRRAGRPKDLVEIEILGALREEVDRQPDD